MTASMEQNGLGDHFKQAVTNITDENNPNFFAGLEITFPIENRAARGQLKAAELEKAKKLLELKLLERKIAVEITDQVRNCNVFKEIAKNSKEIAKLQAQKLEEEEMDTDPDETEEDVEGEKTQYNPEEEEELILTDEEEEKEGEEMAMMSVEEEKVGIRTSFRKDTAEHAMAEKYDITVLVKLLKSRNADELIMFFAPKILGTGVDSIGDLGIKNMNGALELENVRIKKLNSDFMISANLKKESGEI